MQLTFDQLPEAVSQLFSKLDNIERLLLNQKNQAPTETEDLLSIKEAAEFLRLSVPTLYGLTSKSQIPSMKKSKRLYFSRKDLTAWVKEGRRSTKDQIEAGVDLFLSSRRR